MPRIKQLYPKYICEDFIKEIRKKMIDHNYTSFADVARSINIDPRTLYRRIETPEKFRISDLQKIISLLHPNPVIVLTLLGYTKQDITRFIHNASRDAL